MDRYAVMGHPVKHSKSPAIHAAFAEQTGQRIEYTAIDVEPGGFEEAVQDFFRQGGKGLNVTLPFKQEAWQMVEECSEDARVGGAVNTLLLDSLGALVGYNTDGIGIVRDIERNHQGELARKHVLVLGAGGASRGILLPLLRENPHSVTVANRTVEKGESLAETFSPYGPVEACGFPDLQGRQFDWVINATSASLAGDLPPLPKDLLAPNAWCYDLMYGDQETVFCAWAREAGAEKVIDGLGMLVEQAAESFHLWRGQLPDTAPVIAMLRKN